MTRYVIPFNELRMSDVEKVGGKNASLGEMISQLPSSVRVPGGFATTAEAYREFLAHDGLADRIAQPAKRLHVLRDVGFGGRGVCHGLGHREVVLSWSVRG